MKITFDEQLIKIYNEKSRKNEKNVYHVTDIAYIYAFNPSPEEFLNRKVLPYNVMLMLKGESLHKIIQYIFKEKYQDAEIEKSLEKEYNGLIIRGSADIVYKDKIFEIKTSTKRLDFAYLNYKIQSLLYAYFLQKKYAILVQPILNFKDKTFYLKVFDIFKLDNEIHLVEKALDKLIEFHQELLKYERTKSI